jgi:hypothetical protein
MRMRANGTAQAACKILYLLQAQSVISDSLSLARMQQADGDEHYFIMQSSVIAILSKAGNVLSRQVSSTVVALSGIHE